MKKAPLFRVNCGKEGRVARINCYTGSKSSSSSSKSSVSSLSAMPSSVSSFVSSLFGSAYSPYSYSSSGLTFSLRCLPAANFSMLKAF
jgi:hypothetical protein